MHALGEFLHKEIALRGLTPAEFARVAGLSRQNVYQLLDDDRDHLGRLPEGHTAEKLAIALGVPVEVIWIRALEAVGIPTGNLFLAGEVEQQQREHDEVVSLLSEDSDVPDDLLLELVRKRLDKTDVSVDELVELRGMRARLRALKDRADNGDPVEASDLKQVLGE